jgi:hypothetical protein
MHTIGFGKCVSKSGTKLVVPNLCVTRTSCTTLGHCDLPSLATSSVALEGRHVFTACVALFSSPLESSLFVVTASHFRPRELLVPLPYSCSAVGSAPTRRYTQLPNEIWIHIGPSAKTRQPLVALFLWLFSNLFVCLLLAGNRLARVVRAALAGERLRSTRITSNSSSRSSGGSSSSSRVVVIM